MDDEKTDEFIFEFLVELCGHRKKDNFYRVRAKYLCSDVIDKPKPTFTAKMLAGSFIQTNGRKWKIALFFIPKPE